LALLLALLPIRPGRRTIPASKPETSKHWSLMPLRSLGPDQGLVPSSEGTPTQIVLAFDDNRHASVLFGQYGQNLALVERRLGVTAEQRGNHVTLDGSRDGVEQARRVLESLYEQIKRGQDLASGDVEGAIRLAIAQGSLFDFDAASARTGFEEINLRKRPVRARTAAQERLRPRTAQKCAGVRHRPGRHRQDLARRRLCGGAVERKEVDRMVLSRPAVESRRAARLFARRSAREDRFRICVRCTTRCST